MQRRVERGWSTDVRRSSVREGARAQMCVRLVAVWVGFRRRRRSLGGVLVGGVC